MKIEDDGVTAQFVAGRYDIYGPDPDTVVFTDGDSSVAVTLDLIRLVWHAWA